MEIQNIGLGFWQISKEDASRVVKDGLEVGYKMIDTAIAYDNETEIGLGLKESNINREDIYITSKIPAEIKNYKDAKKAIDESIERLGCEYLDLMLIHAPKPWSLMMLPTPRYHKGNIEVYRALMDAQKEGKIKNIGVSNFNINDLKNILKNCEVVPYVNQIRVHIGHVDKKLISFCKENNIKIEAYSPMGTGRLFKNKTIENMAKKYNVSLSQLCIKYDLDLGVIPLPRSKSKNHIEENLKIGDFEISKEDKIILDKIKTF